MNGLIQDSARIASIARDAGALSFVDAYQTLGTVPLDVRALGVDFLASGNLKFLMGIPGIAFLYVRPEIVDTLQPTVTGWFGRANPFAFDADRSTGRRPRAGSTRVRRRSSTRTSRAPAWRSSTRSVQRASAPGSKCSASA